MMLKKATRALNGLLTAAILTLPIVAVTPAQAQATEDKPVRIGWTAWSDAEAVTNIAKQVLEQRLGYKVELVMTDIGLQYQGVARGNLDAMLMAWLPVTHSGYWQKLSNDLVNLGALYTNAKLGWAVPAYIPESEVKTIEDLKKPEVQKKLNGQIQGIDPGAGLMKASEATIRTYGLSNYQLLSASDSAMVAALDRAIKRNEWIVVTTWTPHWMFSRYKLRYLEDPKQTLGTAESVHALSRKGFDKDFPKAAAFLKNFKIPLADLEGIMLRAKDSSYEKEAAAYIKNNPEMVEKWLKDAK
jgi:glycine betaine/proline transport system substrate-binding protein